MKNGKSLMRVAAAAVLATGLAMAQGPGFGGHMMMGRGGFEGRGLERMATVLDLTEGQKAQAKTIFENAREQAKQLAPELQANRQQMQAAVKAGDKERIKSLAAQQADLTERLTVLRAQAMADFYATLTTEQKEKAEAMHGKMKQRMERRSRGANPQTQQQ